MNYKEIKEELNKLEVNDLRTAIKENLLKRLESILSNSNIENTHVITFVDDGNLDDAIYEIEYKIDNLLNEYEEQCIKLLKNNKIKDKEQER